MTTIVEQDADDDRQRCEVLPGGGADAGLGEQHDQDLVGRVRGRRDRVRREHRQRDPLGEALVLLLIRRQRATDQDSFDGHVLQIPVASVGEGTSTAHARGGLAGS